MWTLNKHVFKPFMHVTIGKNFTRWYHSENCDKQARFSIAFSCLTSRPLMNIAAGNNGKPSYADEW